VSGGNPITFGSNEDFLAAVGAAVRAAIPATAPAPPAAAPPAVAAAPAFAPAGFAAQQVTTAAPGWGAAVAPAMPSAAPGGVAGFAFKMTVPLPDGSAIPVDLHFGPEYATPQALTALAQQLVAAGWPIKVYPPRDSGNGFGRSGFGRRGGRGGYGNRGGYDRGGW
jgi:hypothetical protein